MTDPKRLALATAAVAVSLFGCARVPAAPAPGPEAAPPLPPPAALPAPEPAPTLAVQPSIDPRPAPGARRYGGAMAYQGGANMTSWPDAPLREQIWRQLLGPTPALTGRGQWGYAPAPATEDERPD